MSCKGSTIMGVEVPRQRGGMRGLQTLCRRDCCAHAGACWMHVLSMQPCHIHPGHVHIHAD